MVKLPRTTSDPYRNVKAGYRGIGDKRAYFRSAWEANFARYLEWLRQTGQIQNWEHEPQTFWFDKIKRGTRSYLPDFRVIELGGNHTYYEVKGWMDPKSKTKLKRMALYHPEIKLILIDAKSYRGMAATMGGLIPGWE